MRKELQAASCAACLVYAGAVVGGPATALPARLRRQRHIAEPWAPTTDRQRPGSNTHSEATKWKLTSLSPLMKCKCKPNTEMNRSKRSQKKEVVRSQQLKDTYSGRDTWNFKLSQYMKCWLVIHNTLFFLSFFLKEWMILCWSRIWKTTSNLASWDHVSSAELTSPRNRNTIVVSLCRHWLELLLLKLCPVARNFLSQWLEELEFCWDCPHLSADGDPRGLNLLVMEYWNKQTFGNTRENILWWLRMGIW